ncbi:MAG: hypothetical protein M9890_14775 [Thermomicrobiales bacterium]|nr:hypothetical protein [Thermomicrobiales bacterium]
MIAALVLFKNDGTLSLEDAIARFNTTAPNYEGRAGLITKTYIYGEDGAELGGFYLWESREAAESLYTDEWKAKATALYGTAPVFRYFDAPVLVNNLTAAKEAR